MFAGLIAGLLIYVSNTPVVDHVRASKEAWVDCFFAAAKQRNRGKDTPELEKAVAAACHTEREAYIDAMVAEVAPKNMVDVRAKAEAFADGSESAVAHAAVVAAEHP